MLIHRQHEIMSEIIKHGTISVNDLILKINSSPATIRRDLKTLEDNKMILRSHGYVHSINSVEPILPVNKRSLISADEKKKIGVFAAGFIQDGMTLLLDSGTTCLEIAKQIQNKKISVVTNSLEIINTLSGSECKVICCGGMLEKQQLCFLGSDAISFLRKIEVDIAFIGATGVRGTKGLTTSSSHQMDYKKEAVKISNRAFAVFDTSKFYSANLYLFSEFHDLDGIVINEPKQDTKEAIALKEISENGTEVFIAK